MKIGMELFIQRQYTSAIHHFEELLRTDQHHAALQKMGLCCRYLGQYGRAEYYYRLAASVESPQGVRQHSLINLADLLYQRGQYAKSLNLRSQLRGEIKKVDEVFVNEISLAMCLAEVGHYGSAIQSLKISGEALYSVALSRRGFYFQIAATILVAAPTLEEQMVEVLEDSPARQLLGADLDAPLTKRLLNVSSELFHSSGNLRGVHENKRLDLVKTMSRSALGECISQSMGIESLDASAEKILRDIKYARADGANDASDKMTRMLSVFASFMNTAGCRTRRSDEIECRLVEELYEMINPFIAIDVTNNCLNLGAISELAADHLIRKCESSLEVPSLNKAKEE